MATALDFGLLQYFDFIFPVILVFALLFALLQKTELIGKSVGINAMISIAAAFMVLLSRTLIDVINFMIPWFVVAIIFFVLMILIFQTFGAKEESVANALKDQKLQWTLIGVGALILVASFANVLGQSFTEVAFEPGETAVNATAGGVATTSFEANIYATLFHPKVLGLVVFFAIAIFAVALLTGSA